MKTTIFHPGHGIPMQWWQERETLYAPICSGTMSPGTYGDSNLYVCRLSNGWSVVIVIPSDYLISKENLFLMNLGLLEELNRANQNDKAVVISSFYVADDAKQPEKMPSEFYTLVRREAQSIRSGPCI